MKGKIGSRIICHFIILVISITAIVFGIISGVVYFIVVGIIGCFCSLPMFIEDVYIFFFGCDTSGTGEMDYQINNEWLIANGFAREMPKRKKRN